MYNKPVMSTDSTSFNITSMCPRPDKPPIKWIATTFNQCIYNVRSEIGLCLGLISIACWMSAGFPFVVIYLV